MKKRVLVKMAALLLLITQATAQTCPSSGTVTLNSYPNTYYPGQGTVSAGAKILTLGSAPYGTTPISAYDVVLIIQMQGAQITSTNGAIYGDGTGTGSGYMNNANLLAGNMEYAVATAAVPLTGGTLTLSTGLTNSYQTAPYGTDGQYTYQVIRVPVYYNLTLNANIQPPDWNGAVGGVIDLYVSQTLNMNGKSIDVSGAGFRGGGGQAYSGGTGTSNTDFVRPISKNAGGSKGEGIAGTPIHLASPTSGALITGTVEGYPNGSNDRGAPGNAGGGATDGLPSNNSNNAGGGGGGNGGVGGGGGNSWSSNLATGGRGGAVFAQYSPSRLVMGGGGGAGSSDGGSGNPPGGFASSGGYGGGIAIITAAAFSGTGSILANGGAPPATNLANDGGGGGGAGGSILIVSGSGATGLTVSAAGSVGASNTGNGQKHGPGGGGGGGVVYSNMTLGSVSVTGGANGVTLVGFPPTSAYGATSGSAGISSQTITIAQTPRFPIVCNGVLDLKTLSISAQDQNGNTIIQWNANPDDKIANYDVQKSFDSTSFFTVATIKPNSNVNEYRYTDIPDASTSPVIFYRVREKDLNGNDTYSNIVVIEKPGNTPDLAIAIAPNPTSGTATLRLTNERNSLVSLGLFDLTGTRRWYKQYQAVPGVNTWTLDCLQQLPNGIYMLQVNTENKNFVKRICVLR